MTTTDKTTPLLTHKHWTVSAGKHTPLHATRRSKGVQLFNRVQSDTPTTRRWDLSTVLVLSTQSQWWNSFCVHHTSQKNPITLFSNKIIKFTWTQRRSVSNTDRGSLRDNRSSNQTLCYTGLGICETAEMPGWIRMTCLQRGTGSPHVNPPPPAQTHDNDKKFRFGDGMKTKDATK